MQDGVDIRDYIKADSRADKSLVSDVPLGFRGEIKLWPSNTAPAGWQICDGTEVKITSYPELYELIGTTFNTGGETAGYFRVPNLKGKVPVGRDSGDTDFDVLGEQRGSKTHTLAISEIPSHTHAPSIGNFNMSTTANVFATPAGAAEFKSDERSGATAATGGGGAHNNIQPSIVLNFIIKL